MQNFGFLFFVVSRFIYAGQDLAPLSPIVELKESQPSLTLPLASGIRALNSSDLFAISWRDENNCEHLLNADFNRTNATLTVENPRPGKYMAVHPNFRNQLPVVTHWDADMDNGRGGFRRGANGTAGVHISSHRIDRRDIRNTDPDNPYFYDMEKVGLLSPTPSNPKPQRPQFNHLIGDRFAFHSLGDDYIEDFSQRILKSTGFPVLHINGNEGCDIKDLPVRQNFPAFQVIHACIFKSEGQKSLATITLPPYWTLNTNQSYPVLFVPFYDIHQSFYSFGETVLKTQARVRAAGVGNSIGVIWNGGAAFGSFGVQPMIYENISDIFDQLSSKFLADTQKIVAVGLSRGGSTSLAVAGNPHPHSYRVTHVVAYSPATAYGERDTNYRVPTYPGYMFIAGHMAGYKYSWRLGWHEDGTEHTGEKIPFVNTFGTPDPKQVDDLSPISEAQLKTLANEGTKVLFSVGTHDQFLPLGMALEYVKKAKSLNVDIKLRVGYRTGHGTLNRMEIDAYNALTETITDSTDTSPSFQEFRYNQSLEIIPFTPFGAAAVIELPRYVVKRGPFLATIAGSPGLEFKLEICEKEAGEPTLTISGELPKTPTVPGVPLSYSVVRRIWPEEIRSGDYVYRFFFRSENGIWREARLRPGLQKPGVRPYQIKAGRDSKDDLGEILKVIDVEPMIDGETFYFELNGDRGPAGYSTE